MSESSFDDVIGLGAKRIEERGLGGALFRAAVTATDERCDRAERAKVTLEARTSFIALHPALASDVVDGPLPIAEGIDPWTLDPERPPRDVIATCNTCDGRGHHTCDRCQGSLRHKCPECSGAGRVAGARAGGKKCPTCKAKGDVKCIHCREGTADCAACRQSGKVRASIRIERRRQDVVTIAGAGPLGEFTQGGVPYGWRATSTRSCSAEELPGALLPRPVPSGMRIIDAAVESFECPSAVISFRLAGANGSAVLVGDDGRLTSDSNLQPFARMRVLLTIGVLVAILGAVFTAAIYRGRDDWFAEHGATSTLLGAAAVCAVGAWSLWAQLLRPATARSRMVLGMAVIAAIAGLGASAWIWTTQRPSLDVAHAFLATGDDERAVAEARALVAIGTDDPAAKDFLDDIHSRNIAAARESVPTAVAKLERPWFFESKRAAALALITATADQQCQGDGSPELLREVAGALASLAPTVAARCRYRAQLLEADACVASGDLECVDTHLVGLEEADATPLQARAAPAANAQFQACLKDRYAKKLDDRAAALAKCARLSQSIATLAKTQTAPSLNQLQQELKAVKDAIDANARAAAQRQAAADRAAAAAESARAQAAYPSTSVGSRSRLSAGDYTEHVGPRGGVYHYSASGKKVYSKHR